MDAESLARVLSVHLSYEEKAALVDGWASPDVRMAAQAHAAHCAECAADLDALRAIASTMALGTGVARPADHVVAPPRAGASVLRLTPPGKPEDGGRAAPAARIGLRLAVLAAALVVLVLAVKCYGIGRAEHRAAARPHGHGVDDVIIDGHRRITIDSAGVVGGTQGLPPLVVAVITQTLRAAMSIPGAPDSLSQISPDRASALADGARRADSASHLLVGALDERAGRLSAALVEFRTLAEANPSSMAAQRLLGRVKRSDSTGEGRRPAPQ